MNTSGRCGRHSCAAELQVFVQLYGGTMGAPVRNFVMHIANDRELAPLVQKMRNLMQGVDAESLRTSDMLRERMAQQLAKIATQVDQMPAVKRTRLITLED